MAIVNGTMRRWIRRRRRAPDSELARRAAAEARARDFVEKIRIPIGPGDPRRHHFVPQFYLRRFAEKEQLAVLRLGTPGEPTLTSVKNVAVVRDLYTTIDQEVGETVAVERILGQADAEAARVIEGLVSGAAWPLSAEDRAHLAAWIGFLYVRDAYSRRAMEAMVDHASKIDLSLARNPETARERLRGEGEEQPDEQKVQELVDAASNLEDIEIVAHQNELIRMMLSNGTMIGQHLVERHFAVLRLPEPGLVLSDRPVVLHQQPEDRSPLRGVGPATAEEVWLPLDRSTILTLHRDSRVGDRLLEFPSAESLDGLNQSLVASAVTEIYCHPADRERISGLRLPVGGRPLFHVSGVDWASVESDGVNAPPKRERPRRYRRATDDETPS